MKAETVAGLLIAFGVAILLFTDVIYPVLR